MKGYVILLIVGLIFGVVTGCLICKFGTNGGIAAGLAFLVGMCIATVLRLRQVFGR